jgi:hypothetical protein
VRIATASISRGTALRIGDRFPLPLTVQQAFPANNLASYFAARVQVFLEQDQLIFQ